MHGFQAVGMGPDISRRERSVAEEMVEVTVGVYHGPWQIGHAPYGPSKIDAFGFGGAGVDDQTPLATDDQTDIEIEAQVSPDEHLIADLDPLRHVRHPGMLSGWSRSFTW